MGAGVGLHDDDVVDDGEVGVLALGDVGDSPGLVEGGHLGPVLLKGHGKAVYLAFLDHAKGLEDIAPALEKV